MGRGWPILCHVPGSVIQKYTDVGDIVLDPFAGRATSVYSAAVQGRIGIGIELNPVGWLYGKAKLHAAKREDVEERIQQLAREAPKHSRSARQLPLFFRHCFTHQVRCFLLAARSQLNWQRRVTDWTTMALLLVNLHGKRRDSMSNQMRQTKSMAPSYAVRWWKDRALLPPDIDPVVFMEKKLSWRYAKGRPAAYGSRVYLGDCIQVLPRLKRAVGAKFFERASLLFTSPPYYGVTNYHYDQWLRLWMLGFSPATNCNNGKYRGRFGNRDEYAQLIERAFYKASFHLRKDAVIYVRTDSREFTFQTTLQILRQVFPRKKISVVKQPFHGPTQTHLFGDQTPKVGEIDLVLEP